MASRTTPCLANPTADVLISAADRRARAGAQLLSRLQKARPTLLTSQDSILPDVHLARGARAPRRIRSTRRRAHGPREPHRVVATAFPARAHRFRARSSAIVRSAYGSLAWPARADRRSIAGAPRVAGARRSVPQRTGQES